MSWESHLCRIDDWKEVSIGRISAKGCGNKDDSIYIYKLQDGKEMLIEKLKIDTILNEQKEKWTFIKNYWKKNYRKFEG